MEDKPADAPSAALLNARDLCQSTRLTTEDAMLLLNPKYHDRFYPDDRLGQIMQKTIAWFQERGLKKITQDDYDRTGYADFLEFVQRARLFATLLTSITGTERDGPADCQRRPNLLHKDSCYSCCTSSAGRHGPLGAR